MSIILPHNPKFFAAAAGYTANAVYFDGTNDYLQASTLTGAADSKLWTLSFWVKITTEQLQHYGGGYQFTAFRAAASAPSGQNNVQIQAANSSGTAILDVQSTANSIQAADGWVHVLWSCDLTDTGKRHLYINDTSDLATVTTYTDDTIDFTSNRYNLGSRGNGGLKLDGDMADWYYNAGVYIDFSVESNRRKFIDASGKPVDLGSDGSTPTGTAPIWFHSGDTATWATNDGSGGGLTETGALTTSSSSPSD